MIRAFFAVLAGVLVAVLAANGGRIGWFDVTGIPLALVAFVVATGAVLYSLRRI
ncbi:hypothetical protein ACUN0C_06045 [Faunimonas sp. B44]|uniref:hypothetical protein n=1 Tax=Faunimonas sp. B44 TaxID=3461493 RepID=UPI004044F25D